MNAAAGEYIAAEKIEAAYKKNSMVEQIWVYGNSLESTLVAIVVPVGKHISQHLVTSHVGQHTPNFNGGKSRFELGGQICSS